MPIFFYNKKVITKSSIESELAGVADYLQKALSLKLSIETQGFMLNRNMISQDNQSVRNKTVWEKSVPNGSMFQIATKKNVLYYR